MDFLIPLYDERYVRLHRRSFELIKSTPAEKFYWKPRGPSDGSPNYSCGESILRSAGTVEQTFGGITSNLWDDPVEWTLPESLSSRDRIQGYLNEVETTRRRGFAFFKSDDDLFKEIVVPSGETQMISVLLMDTFFRAARYQGYAFNTFRLFSDAPIPRL